MPRQRGPSLPFSSVDSSVPGQIRSSRKGFRAVGPDTLVGSLGRDCALGLGRAAALFVILVLTLVVLQVDIEVEINVVVVLVLRFAWVRMLLQRLLLCVGPRVENAANVHGWRQFAEQQVVLCYAGEMDVGRGEKKEKEIAQGGRW